MIMIHPFEEAIKGLTGLPPFHNYKDDYWTGMSKAEKLSQNNIGIVFEQDELNMAVWLSENINGYYCQMGCSVVFEDKEDAMRFKLTWK